MKRVALLSTFIFLTTSMVLAQSNVLKQIDRQYLNEAHKAFIYQVSPHAKDADKWVMEMLLSNENNHPQKRLSADELNSDTTWAYEEYKLLGDTVNNPGKYSLQHASGNTDKYVRYYNQYIWFADSSNWLPNRLSANYYDVSYGDSSTTTYYRNGETEPYTGTRYRNPNIASEGADRETFSDNYLPETGWQKYTRELRYKNEFEQDTLIKAFRFDQEVEDYILESIRRNRQAEDYYLYENEYYQAGEIYSRDTQEQTPAYLLTERRYYSEGAVSSGQRSYTKIGEDKRYIYQTEKEYVPELMKWVGTDSLHFTYSNNDKETEAEGFAWNDSVWVLDEAYTSFQHELNGVFVADSILVYEVVQNEETMTPEIGRIWLKTEMYYDEAGNQIEVRGFTIIDDSLQMNSKTVRAYKKLQNINDEDYYLLVKQETYGRDFLTGELYQANVLETNYDGSGVFQGNSYFNFSAAGDTTYGYITQREVLPEGETIEVRFEWDFTQQALILKSYRIYNRRTTGDQGQGFNQTVFASIVNGEEAINRSMNVYNNYPGIFNDGPIYAEMGDTLVYYISARNPDFSIPKIEVSNMPSSAIFNPETNRFFWIVDEVSPSPMTYKAIKGDKFVTTEVEFITEQFAVTAEEELSPKEFKLSQNYPNPFNPSTNITFNLPQAGDVSLKVYNMLGQEVANIISEKMGQGNHTVTFEASRLSSGMYIYRLQAGGLSQTRKMLLIK